jgi:hypothetical protein
MFLPTKIFVLAGALFAQAYPSPPAANATNPNQLRTPAQNQVVLSRLASIEREMQSTSYQHRSKIVPTRGIYQWDCSIMAGWILQQATPKARQALPAKPLARDFYDRIVRSDRERPRRGWLRLHGPQAIEPGDIFAWRKAEMFKYRNNTGHVGFVMSKPWQHPKYPSIWVMRIADSTRELHEHDSRPVGGEGGFGTAMMAFYFDASGEAVSYGWYGEAQEPETFVPTHVVFGRAVH